MSRRRERDRARIEARKAAGMCTSCGKRKSTPPFATCDVCRKYFQDRRKKAKRPSQPPPPVKFEYRPGILWEALNQGTSNDITEGTIRGWSKLE